MTLLDYIIFSKKIGTTKKKRFELNANNNITETGHVHEMVIMVM